MDSSNYDYESDFEEYTSGEGSVSDENEETESRIENNNNNEKGNVGKLAPDNKTEEDEDSQENESEGDEEEEESEKIQLEKKEEVKFENKNNDLIKSPIPIINSIKETPKTISNITKKEVKWSKEKIDRGNKLKALLKLDNVSNNLLVLNPISYDKFMRYYATFNSIQATTQTNENRLDEESQTELVSFNEKWTQKPPLWSDSKKWENIKEIRQEAVGCGEICKPEKSKENIVGEVLKLKNTENLSKLLSRTNDFISAIIESGIRLKSNKSVTEHKFKLSRGLSIFSNLEIHNLICEGGYLACSNRASAENKSGAGSKNLITIWSIQRPSMPQHILRVWGEVTVLKIDSISQIVICGLEDGSLNVWNLRDAPLYEKQFQKEIIRTPSINTSCLDFSNKDNNSLEVSHCVIPIIDIGIIRETHSCLLVVSLNKERTLITWTCIISDRSELSNTNYHNNAWTSLRFTLREIIPIEKYFMPASMDVLSLNIWENDNGTSACFFGTNIGLIFKGILNNKRPDFESLQSDEIKALKTTCIDVNQNLGVLSAGFENGFCQIFNEKRNTLVLMLNCNGVPWTLKWSKRKTSVIFIAVNDRIDLWDISINNLTPVKSYSFSSLRGFDIFQTDNQEFMAILQKNEIKIQGISSKTLTPLTITQQEKLKYYFAIV